MTGCKPDTEAREKRIASFSGFHHSVHTGHWSVRCLLAQPCVDGALLKAGGRYSRPLSQTNTEIALQGGKRSASERH